MVPAFALLLASAACGGGSAASTTTSTVPLVLGTGGTISIGIDRPPTSCNPHLVPQANWASQLVLNAVLPSTFIQTDGGNVTGNQAFTPQAELQSITPQKVVYTINPKAVWSDGVPITAKDFIYAWQEQRGSLFDSNSSVDTLGYRDIASVTGSNKGKTVTVVFAKHFADWRMLFNQLLPAHVMEKVGWNPGCTSLSPTIDLSGGPFKIASVTPSRVVLVKNPLWWGQEPNLDRLVVRIATGGTAQLTTWISNGTAQVVLPSGFDQAYLAQVSGDASVNSETDISSTFLQLEFNTAAPTTETAEVRQAVRQAVASAIDRQALVNQVVGWSDINIVPAASHIWAQNQSSYPSTPSSTPVNQTTTTNSTTTTTTAPGATTTTTTPTEATPWPLTANPAQTKELLTSEGYTQSVFGTWTEPDGTPLVVRLVVDDGDPWATATGVKVVAQLQGAGFTVVVSHASSADAAGMALSSGQADAALLPMVASSFPSQALAWYTPLLGPPGEGGSQNWTNLDDPALNALLLKASQNALSLNPSYVPPIYAQADAILWSTMAALPLFAQPTTLAWSDKVTGVGPNPHGPGLLWNPEPWGVLVPANTTTTSAG